MKLNICIYLKYIFFCNWRAKENFTFKHFLVFYFKIASKILARNAPSALAGTLSPALKISQHFP